MGQTLVSSQWRADLTGGCGHYHREPIMSELKQFKGIAVSTDTKVQFETLRRQESASQNKDLSQDDLVKILIDSYLEVK